MRVRLHRWRRFQFTPLREGRRRSKSSITAHLNFNSRPSARGDDYLTDKPLEATDISIHAPPRGATSWHWRSRSIRAISIHAPPRGATLHSAVKRPRRDDFNSRPSARGDTKQTEQWLSFSYFNSRPSARGDRKRSTALLTSTNFNSRPSARGDNAAVVRGRESRHYFNSRPSARGDAAVRERQEADGTISIHAPPRGATSC